MESSTHSRVNTASRWRTRMPFRATAVVLQHRGSPEHNKWFKCPTTPRRRQGHRRGMFRISSASHSPMSAATRSEGTALKITSRYAGGLAAAFDAGCGTTQPCHYLARGFRIASHPLKRAAVKPLIFVLESYCQRHSNRARRVFSVWTRDATTRERCGSYVSLP